MTHGTDSSNAPTRHPLLHQGSDGGDRIASAADYLRGILSAGGEALGKTPFARMEEGLRQWARDLGALLDPAQILPRLRRGGQEHDVFDEGPRVFKVTKNGYFGFSPGLDIALETKGRQGKKFHLWEATPLEYLERLRLQNVLTPDLVRLEGVLNTPSDLAIVTSQLRFNIVPVSEAEIEAWFKTQGFFKITHSAYYREPDNLAVFDAHDKNVVRLDDRLMPFDVIPCHPDTCMLAFIQEAKAAGHELRAVRSSHTTSRVREPVPTPLENSP